MPEVLRHSRKYDLDIHISSSKMCWYIILKSRNTIFDKNKVQLSPQSFLESYLYEGLEKNKNIEDHKARRFFSFYIHHNNTKTRFSNSVKTFFENLIPVFLIFNSGCTRFYGKRWVDSFWLLSFLFPQRFLWNLFWSSVCEEGVDSVKK